MRVGAFPLGGGRLLPWSLMIDKGARGRRCVSDRKVSGTQVCVSDGPTGTVETAHETTSVNPHRKTEGEQSCIEP